MEPTLNSQFSILNSAKLHLGCGPHHLDGWINVDNAPYPGVDQVLDVTQGLPFADVERIFAEHFIEHFAYDVGARLLAECRRVLRDDGVLRLSTPNLDWVWATHYQREMSAEEEVIACFGINRAFRGWGHQFLYNERTLTATLHAAGFADVLRCEYGASSRSELRNLERHERNEDAEGLSHILIVEAWGRGGEVPPYFDDYRSVYLRDVAVK